MIVALVVAAGATALVALAVLVIGMRRAGRLTVLLGVASAVLAMAVVVVCAAGVALAT